MNHFYMQMRLNLIKDNDIFCSKARNNI